ncbi:acyl-CoA dehydrogenase [Roseivirga seohaensis subsp. aquiponti]|uniref:Acyl-CoA dehydrogenase n=1 Tax=Roseivirga seohaensis subsp. aquiponti TaxID=1566026 RepID=A0A0L8AIE3_9BACT|nr:acyl-CoA dehydrogenase [Roseivirga seohaensis]KOF02134.1 acyl-CoA dehydrogenase [Roseivirga seohaensis subsp. aquiponti]
MPNPSQYTNLNTIKFLMYNVHQTEELLEANRYAAYDKPSIDLLLDSVKTFCDKSLHPFIKEMDEKPSSFANGVITIHPQFESILKESGEMGLVAAMFEEKDGGLQLPNIVFHTLYFMMEAANNHVTGYLGLTAGAANLIVSFGNDFLKETYAQKMMSLEWTGTMCLTEPQAGSSLSDVKTTASLQEDGTYKINGQKIFISSGDHQFAENIIHLVLARTEGAPSGTKGVSLFVVPKKIVAADGSLGKQQVIVAGEFEKLGQRGYCTSHLVFEDSVGHMIGDENHGLIYMFQMMNEARIATGRMGTGIASAAYYASLQYAKERPQGRKLTSSGKKDLDEDQTLIINHPDVKRMLLFQKAIVEGSLSLVMQAAHYVDLEHISEGEEKGRYNLLLELLTPIAKTYPSEKGLEAVSTGLQVLGGYGFCMDFILQQYYRDIRIISIYEGTTGIQSLDLLGRKVGLKNGKVLEWLAEEIQSTIKEASAHDSLQFNIRVLGESLNSIQQVLGALMPHAQNGDFERYLADATIFMDLFGTVVMGWQWLKIGVSAQKALDTNDSTYATDFYESKLHTLQFFYKYEMSRCKGLSKTIMNELALTIDMKLSYLD